MQEVSKSKKALFIAILISLPIFSLIALELSAHFYMYLKFGVAGKSYGIWRSDKELGARHKENSYNTKGQINNYGFRNREDVFEPKPDGSKRIIAYGGSTTFCYNLFDVDAWPNQLQQVIRKNEINASKDQVLNGGAVGWSIGHVFARMKTEVPKLKPDYIILYSGINEYINNAYMRNTGKSITEYVKEGKYGVIAKNMDQNSWIRRNILLIKIFDKYIRPKLTLSLGITQEDVVTEKIDPEPELLANYLYVLDQVFNYLKQQNIKVIFVPQIHKQGDLRGYHFTSYSAKGVDVAKKHNVMIFDPRMELSLLSYNYDDFFATCCHLSKKGATFFANYLYSQLKSAGIY